MTISNADWIGIILGKADARDEVAAKSSTLCETQHSCLQNWVP